MFLAKKLKVSSVLYIDTSISEGIHRTRSHSFSISRLLIQEKAKTCEITCT